MRLLGFPVRLAGSLALWAMLLLLGGPLAGQLLVPTSMPMPDMHGHAGHVASAERGMSMHDGMDMQHDPEVPWAKCGYCSLPFHLPAAASGMSPLLAAERFLAPTPEPLPTLAVLSSTYPTARSRAPPQVS